MWNFVDQYFFRWICNVLCIDEVSRIIWWIKILICRCAFITTNPPLSLYPYTVLQTMNVFDHFICYSTSFCPAPLTLDFERLEYLIGWLCWRAMKVWDFSDYFMRQDWNSDEKNSRIILTVYISCIETVVMILGWDFDPEPSVQPTQL